jgi:hypothetical protein
VWCVIYYLYKQTNNVEYNLYASMNKQYNLASITFIIWKNKVRKNQNNLYLNMQSNMETKGGRMLKKGEIDIKIVDECLHGLRSRNI